MDSLPQHGRCGGFNRVMVVWGGFSVIFNFPRGGQGAILSPNNAVFWSKVDGAFGPNWATLTTSIFAYMSSMIAVMWLGRGYRLSYLACGCMALAFGIPRYFAFTLGETGVVGIAILPLILGWGALVRYQEESKIFWGWCFAVCLVLQGWENPYLAPFLPLIALFFASKNRDIWKYILGGCVALGCVAFLYHGASAGNYESIRPTSYTHFWVCIFPLWTSLGTYFLIFRDETNLRRQEVWIPFTCPVVKVWGGLVLFAGLGGWLCHLQRCLGGFDIGGIGIVFATGSTWFGSTSPFGLFNSICEQIVRPLTQPTRFLLLSIISLPLLVGFFVRFLESQEKYRWLGVCVYGILLAESFYWGGFSVRIPTTPIPESDCIRELADKEGGVLIWPWDGIDDERKDATLKSRWLQIAHERPAATIGTGSWPLVGTYFPGHHLRAMGWTDLAEGQGELDLQGLYEEGFRWIVIDSKGPTMPVIRGKERFLLGKRSSCDQYEVYELKGVLEDEQ